MTSNVHDRTPPADIHRAALAKANAARAEKARQARAEVEAMRERIKAAGGGMAPGDIGHGPQASLTLATLATQPRHTIPDTALPPLEQKPPSKPLTAPLVPFALIGATPNDRPTPDHCRDPHVQSRRG